MVVMIVACGGSPAPVQPGAEGVQTVPSEGREHVPEGSAIQYKHKPPTSGPHYPVAARYGVYPEVIPEGYWVHNLEHGAIVVLYRCPEGQETCPDVVKQLQQLYQAAAPGKYGEVKLVASQYPALKTPFATLAWTHIRELDRYDQARMLDFYREFLDKGPEDVP